MEYRIGLDIGIGSVGWAVVSAKQDGHPARIEDFGTRIFDSGENVGKSASATQERRSFRSVRRLERRRSHRKMLLRNHFQKIGMINPTFNDDLADCTDADVYSMKVAGLDRKLSPAELYRCLVHTCNHRGYQDFYEPEEDDDKVTGNELAANEFENAYRDSGCRSISEYIAANYQNGSFVKFRNRTGNDLPLILIRRTLLREEAAAILNAQQAHYPVLTDTNIAKTLEIIFNQRDFEDGPGDPSDSTRRYHGFLETLGMCPFYKDQKRGFRGTVIADVFAVTNTLSQYRFVETATGEYRLDRAVAAELVNTLLENAKLTMTDVKKILKSHGYQLLKGEKSDDKALGKAVKFLALAKNCLGEEYTRFVSQEQFDPEHPSDLHIIGELLSTYQTPSRRKREMDAAGLSRDIIKVFSAKKLSGTAAASYRYMCDAIQAFMSGDIYGNFQAETVKHHLAEAPVQRVAKLKPKHIDDPEVRNNPVVYKSINETRKIINAIIEIYGSPTEIVIEVASELGQSMQARSLEQNRQRRNETANDAVKADIAKMLGIEIAEVKGDMVDRYRLFDEQEGKCIYSGRPLGEKKDVISNRSHAYEVDHIIPFSLILDNTLNNKALVYAGENQRKGQQTPLMYLDPVRADAFRASVNRMYSRKEQPISRKKYGYYLQSSLHGQEAEEILSNWKSRNINDTRYITKYIAGILDKYLLFAGDQKQHVHTVKGSVTQKFRREWLRTLEWGEPVKNRGNYMNHAIDALIAANLTRAYIELGSDAMRLRSIYFANHKKCTAEYYDYLNSCIRKMANYYHFSESYTSGLLNDPHRIPSYIPRLAEEVAVRFTGDAPEAFGSAVRRFYGDHAEFVVPPHVPQFSLKPKRKYQGQISDSNPIRIAEIDGSPVKISRCSIQELDRKKLNSLYTGDPSLTRQLEEILSGKGDNYTVGDYLKESMQTHFRTESGQIIRKVSVIEGKVSNFYRKELGAGNHTVLGGLKYYCVEIYENTKGQTCTCGVRFVDIVKKGGKLWRKPESMPEDYCKHIMYMQPGDYIEIKDANGCIKVCGFFQSVKAISRSQFYFYTGNSTTCVVKAISLKDKAAKYDISNLGHIGGKVRCSEPLPFIGEKE